MSSRLVKALAEPVLLSSAGSSTMTAGALASEQWIRARGMTPPRGSWRIECFLGTGRDEIGTAFGLELSNAEWGCFFCHGGRRSDIRVLDRPVVLERDDHMLVARIPPLRDLGALLLALESRYGVLLDRRQPAITATHREHEQAMRQWIASL